MTVADEATRRQAIEKELKAVETKDDHERERDRLPWRDERPLFDVIRLPLDMVVLNPNSHRIQSQLESESPERRELIKNSPFGEEAQDLIAQIIENTDGFADVLAEMEERGQEDPGVVTRVGVLINANTRVVALRKLNPHGFVNVMVLPADPDPKDVARLELDLQERREVKQPYTFTNSLLFQEQLASVFEYSDDDMAKALRIDKDPKKAVADVQQRTRILALIREIQKRSQGQVRLTYFDNQRVALEELDAAYQSARKVDPDAAERIKDTRVLGILTGVEYRHLRRFDAAEKVDDYVVTALTDPDVAQGPVRDAIHGALATTAETPDLPGLDALADDDDDHGAANLGALIDLVAQSHQQDALTIPTADGPVEITWDELRAPVAQALDEASEEAKTQAEAEKSLDGPTEFMAQAHQRAERARQAYVKIATHADFDRVRFVAEVDRLATVVDAVRAEVDKHSS